MLSLSAVLQFRHVYDHPSWTAPFTISPATEQPPYRHNYDMLIDEKNNSVEAQETRTSLPPSVVEPTTTHNISKPLEDGHAPPNYAEAVGTANPPVVSDLKYRIQPGTSTSAEGTKEGAIPAPANYVHVFKRDGSILGQWNIQPALLVPSELLLSSEEREKATATISNWAAMQKKSKPKAEVEEEPANLTLHTRDGRIQADVWIADSNEEDALEEEAKKCTKLDLHTRDGGVVLRVRTHGTRPLHIRAYTHDGHIRVFLPRSFTGLVQHEIYDGKLVFSPAMHPSVSTFSQVDGKRGASFIGDWQTAMKDGENALGNWQGDRCEATSRDGSLYFFWEDEFEAEWARKSNWFKALFM